MANYIFFIGGSGARAYTAFIHCAAAGVIETRKVSAMMIDADITNQANVNAKNLYATYKEIYGMVHGKSDRTVFTCDIGMETEEILSPVHTDALSLDAAVGGVSTTRKRILDCFYTEEERTQSLEHGFYAHPNIGCVFFSDFQCDEFNQCLAKINTQLNNGENVAVALVGSIFGGTGAAGIPTIFKLLRDRLGKNGNYARLSVGGIFFEPYFTVNGAGQEGDIAIRTEEFYFNTYEALSYYQATQNAGFQSIYLVGQQKLDRINNRYADGGPGQDNKPHVVEIYAALALDHFFTQPEQRGIFGAVRKGSLGWQDFPRLQTGAHSNKMLGMADFARAQSVFLTEICGYIDARSGKLGKWGIMVPQWYVHYGLYHGLENHQLKAMSEYSKTFIGWLYKVNCRCDERGKLSLDDEINLFGPVLQNIFELSHSDYEQEKKINLKAFRNNFKKFVDTTANIRYVWDRVVPILSILGTVPVKNHVLGIAALFLEVVSLAGRHKEKKKRISA